MRPPNPQSEIFQGFEQLRTIRNESFAIVEIPRESKIRLGRHKVSDESLRLSPADRRLRRDNHLVSDGYA